MSSAVVADLRGISHVYGETRALDDVSLSVPAAVSCVIALPVMSLAPVPLESVADNDLSTVDEIVA